MANMQHERAGQAEHPKAGKKSAPPKHEPPRTPESRHDKESKVGGSHPSPSREGKHPQQGH